MINLYDYTNKQKVVLESFDNWLSAEKALETFKKNNPARSGFIAGMYKGELRIDNDECPINIMDLIDLRHC